MITTDWSPWYHCNSQTMPMPSQVLLVLLLIVWVPLSISQTLSERGLFSTIREGLPAYSEPKSGPFVVEMIHALHVDSPYAQLNLTYWQLVDLLFKSSEERRNFLAERINRSKNTTLGTEHFLFTPPVLFGLSCYILKIEIGTPQTPSTPRQIFHLGLDTGSDLTWMQCHPCTSCYPQNDRLYDRGFSSSYRILPCNHEFCHLLPATMWTCSRIHTCEYTVRYRGDGHSIGDLIMDKFNFYHDHLPSPVIGFGCGHTNTDPFRGVAGVVGMGRGAVSLISQLHMTIFSFCLLRFGYVTGRTSKLHLGGTPGDINSEHYTPIFSHAGLSFYFVHLDGISIDNTRIFWPHGMPGQGPQGDVDFLVDSGSVSTRLVPALYTSFRQAMLQRIHYPSADSGSPQQDLCYNLGGLPYNSRFPSASFHLRRLDIHLEGENLFVEIRTSIFCLAVAADLRADPLNVFGAVQLQGMQVTFDLARDRLIIETRDCDP